MLLLLTVYYHIQLILIVNLNLGYLLFLDVFKTLVRNHSLKKNIETHILVRWTTYFVRAIASIGISLIRL